jgi:hypothetical protein
MAPPYKQIQRKRKINRPRSTLNSPNGPSTGATAYRGRTGPPRSLMSSVQLELTYLKGYNTITSTAGGVIAPSYSNTDPFTLSIPGFSTYAALYKEYRVLAIKVQYTPNLDGAVNNVLIAGSPFIIGSDHKGTLTATSYADIQNQTDSRLTAVNRKWTHVARAISPDEMVYTSTGGAQSIGWGVNSYASGYAATTGYGSTLVTYTIQFAQRV